MRSGRVAAVALLSALVLSIAAPAFAKGDFEFVITGGGLRHPVIVDSVDIYAAVHGTIWSPQANVPSLSGPRYALDMYGLNGGRRTYETRWWYYPAKGGALMADSSGGNGQLPMRWQRFSPAFQKVLDDAIKSKPVSNVLVLAVVGLLLVGVLFFVRKELHKLASQPAPASLLWLEGG
jgi:hypothetical protein